MASSGAGNSRRKPTPSSACSEPTADRQAFLQTAAQWQACKRPPVAEAQTLTFSPSGGKPVDPGGICQEGGAGGGGVSKGQGLIKLGSPSAVTTPPTDQRALGPSENHEAPESHQLVTLNPKGHLGRNGGCLLLPKPTPGSPPGHCHSWASGGFVLWVFC